METFRIEVGHAHGVKPGNIVGAIANETGIDGDHIARIRIEDDYSTVELPAGMPKELIEELKKIRVAGQQLNISRLDDSARRSKPVDADKKVDKSKKRMGSTSRRSERKKKQQLNISRLDDSTRRAKPVDADKKVDKSKKRMGSTSRRAKPKAAE